MQLDWFTIIAQVVNFLLLVALLKRFLYGPIIRAMDSREAHIAARLEHAQTQIAEAERQADAYAAQRQALEAQQATFLDEAKAAAETQRQQLLVQARQEVQQLQERWQHTLEQEQTSFLHDLRTQAGQQLCAVARLALADLASIDLEQAVIATFLKRLGDMAEADRQAFVAAAHDTGVTVRSAFPLTPETRQRLLQEVQTYMTADLAYSFVTKPDMLCGIELEAHGRKIAWHLAHYVDSLEAHIRTTLEQETMTQSATA